MSLIPNEVAKSAEGIYLKLPDNEGVRFVPYKPIELKEAGPNDDLKFFRKVNIGGAEKHIKYIIHLREVATGDVKEWQVGSANAINQLMNMKADVGDTIEIEKIKTGERPQDVRYRLKMVKKNDGSQKAAEPGEAAADEPPVPDDDEIRTEDIPM